MRRSSILLACLFLSITVSGCNTLSGTRWTSAFTPPPDHSRVAGNESSDPWIASAAQEGRAGHPTESANDPLRLRRFFMSQEHRDIEANFGIVED